MPGDDYVVSLVVTLGGVVLCAWLVLRQPRRANLER